MFGRGNYGFISPQINMPYVHPILLKNESIPKKTIKTSSDSFRMNIQSFVNYAEAHKFKVYEILFICKKFGFQRRRFYDLINVLEAIGCCKKTNINCISWIGISNIKNTLHEMKENVEKSSNLLPKENLIAISSLTVSFIMQFYANKTETLEIKKIGTFLSSYNGRYKTTVCKLYQVAYILESIGVINKNCMVQGGVSLAKKYYYLEKSNPSTLDPYEFFSISSLLNRPSNFNTNSNI